LLHQVSGTNEPKTPEISKKHNTFNKFPQSYPHATIQLHGGKRKVLLEVPQQHESVTDLRLPEGVVTEARTNAGGQNKCWWPEQMLVARTNAHLDALVGSSNARPSTPSALSWLTEPALHMKRKELALTLFCNNCGLENLTN
jgi:hypothetical protein